MGSGLRGGMPTRIGDVRACVYVCLCVCLHVCRLGSVVVCEHTLCVCVCVCKFASFYSLMRMLSRCKSVLHGCVITPTLTRDYAYMMRDYAYIDARLRLH